MDQSKFQALLKYYLSCMDAEQAMQLRLRKNQERQTYIFPDKGSNEQLFSQALPELKIRLREAGLVFSTWMREWRTLLDGGILTKRQVRQIVAVQVASRIDDYGRNHYEVALLEAILEQIDALFPALAPRVRRRIVLED